MVQMIFLSKIDPNQTITTQIPRHQNLTYFLSEIDQMSQIE